MGGGVCLYVRKDISAQEVFADYVPARLEVLWVRLRSSNCIQFPKHIFVCFVYSPPRSQYHKELSDHLVHMTDIVRAQSDNAAFLIMGDFNDFDGHNLEHQTLLI